MIDSVADKLESFAPATAQKNINLAILDQIVFSVPPLQEQTEIISRAQHLFTLADQLEARLTIARKVVDRLTPALLAKAFRGELVPQDPNDEPASVLLERIRAARQAEAGACKPSRRGRKKAATNPDQIAMEAAPVSADFLTGLLRECGALSERALLAVSELEPKRFQQQLYRELESGTAREVQDNGQVLLEAVG
jgi:type I restriction enzyme S subunit